VLASENESLQLAPGETGTWEISANGASGKRTFLNVWICSERETSYSDAGHEVARFQAELPQQLSAPETSVDYVAFQLGKGGYFAQAGERRFTVGSESGLLESWLYEGQEMLLENLKECFVRAPLDNDICSSDIDHPSPDSWLADWRAAGLFELSHECLEIVIGDNRELLMARHGYYYQGTLVIQSIWEYRVTSDGQLESKIKIDVTPETPSLPRVGVVLNLVQKPDGVRWFGRGPHENYPDRKTSADIGWWQQSRKAMHTPYIFPSENGLRCDVTCLEVGSISVTGKFAFSVSDYGLQELMSAQHDYELNEQPSLYVHIDGYHMGVGGDDSWSRSVRGAYLLTEPEYAWSFTLG
jgi:beta-galactosidase